MNASGFDPPTRGLTAARPAVVVVSGLSGAGKSQALHALEDLGFFCVDNLPTLLVPQAVALCERGGMTRVALGIDVRVRAFLGEVGNVLQLIEAGGERDLHVLFLDATDETLLRRFSETRRPHPLASEGPAAPEGALAVLDGVRVERERLAPLRASATRIIDTTNMSVHDLRRVLIAQLGPASGGAPRMATRIVSFGFKYGSPVDADVVLDVRFLDNPYFVPELRALSGLDEPVSRHVLSSPEAAEFLKRFSSLLEYVMPRYEREGKSYLTIGIGCTGGRHRSVAIAEALARYVSTTVSGPVAVIHRDLQRGQGAFGPTERMQGAPGSEGDRDSSTSVELKDAASAPPPASVAGRDASGASGGEASRLPHAGRGPG